MSVLQRRKLIASSILLCLICTLVSGCNRYRLTVNARSVFEPAPLFKDHRIADQALAQCVEQAIIDQQVTRPAQLSKLSCSHAGLISLEGITVFTGLIRINLKGNSIIGIKPLLFLPRLESVNLEDNPSLNCQDAALLEEQLSGELLKPKHCRQIK